jgi:hypothetical protein
LPLTLPSLIAGAFLILICYQLSVGFHPPVRMLADQSSASSPPGLLKSAFSAAADERHFRGHHGDCQNV